MSLVSIRVLNLFCSAYWYTYSKVISGSITFLTVLLKQ